MDNNNNNKLELTDPDNIYGCKRFRKRYGNEIYLNLVNQKRLLNMHPCQRRIRPKKQIIFIADDHLNNNQHESILFGDDEQQIINDGLLAEDNNDTIDDVVMEEEKNVVFDFDDDDNYLSNNDDIDDDDWHNINEEEEDEIIHQMHGGGNCFEDGTIDDFDDEQEEDIVRSYYSNSFNLLEDYCLMIADKIKRRADEIFQQDDDVQQNLYPNSSVIVKDCSLMIRNYTSKHKVTNQGELSLVLLLKKLLPSNANLPFHQTKYGSYVSDVDNVLNQENLIRGVKDFDICPLNGCTVFVGDDEFKFQCPSCKTNRYTNCKECTRNKKKIDDLNGDNKCQHSGRLVKKQLSYKCILPTILKAILQPCFLKLINFKSYNYINGDNQNQYICDIINSLAYKEGMEQMKNDFEKLMNSKKNDVYITNKTIHVPLLFSIFYDGIRCFTTKTNISYSPLFLTILNLPPLLRSIIGLG
jgi:hypothetical protein